VRGRPLSLWRSYVDLDLKHFFHFSWIAGSHYGPKKRNSFSGSQAPLAAEAVKRELNGAATSFTGVNMAIMGEDSIRPRMSDARCINEMIGIKMFDACLTHFSAVPPNLGVGNRSCNAAVAVAGDTQDPEPLSILFNGVSVSFSLRYGSSRLHQGYDPTYNVLRAFQDRDLSRNTNNSLRRAANFVPNDGTHRFAISSENFFEHAEQTAILTAERSGVPFFRMGLTHHLYIDFRPCGPCRAWLEARPELWYLHIAEGAVDSDPNAFQRNDLAEMKEAMRRLISS